MPDLTAAEFPAADLAAADLTAADAEPVVPVAHPVLAVAHADRSGWHDRGPAERPVRR